MILTNAKSPWEGVWTLRDAGLQEGFLQSLLLESE